MSEAERETITYLRRELMNALEALREPEQVIRVEIADSLSGIPALGRIRTDVLDGISAEDTDAVVYLHRTQPDARRALEGAFRLGVAVSRRVASGWWPNGGFEPQEPLADRGKS